MSNVSKKTRELVLLTLFSAIIFIMAFTPFLGYIPLGASKATTIHIPVIIGAIVLGPKKGAILGFLFGLTSFISNSFLNPTITSFAFTPLYKIGDIGGNPLSLVICFLPRILVGVVPYYIYKLLKAVTKKLDSLWLIIAGICGSMTNTLLVMNLIYFFFGKSYAQVKEIDYSILYKTAIVPVIGINGIMEAIVAAIISTAVCTAIFKYEKRKSI